MTRCVCWSVSSQQSMSIVLHMHKSRRSSRASQSPAAPTGPAASASSRHQHSQQHPRTAGPALGGLAHAGLMESQRGGAGSSLRRSILVLGDDGRSPGWQRIDEPAAGRVGPRSAPAAAHRNSDQSSYSHQPRELFPGQRNAESSRRTPAGRDSTGGVAGQSLYATTSPSSTFRKDLPRKLGSLAAHSHSHRFASQEHRVGQPDDDVPYKSLYETDNSLQSWRGIKAVDKSLYQNSASRRGDIPATEAQTHSSARHGGAPVDVGGSHSPRHSSRDQFGMQTLRESHEQERETERYGAQSSRRGSLLVRRAQDEDDMHRRARDRNLVVADDRYSHDVESRHGREVAPPLAWEQGDAAQYHPHQHHHHHYDDRHLQEQLHEQLAPVDHHPRRHENSARARDRRRGGGEGKGGGSYAYDSPYHQHHSPRVPAAQQQHSPYFQRPGVGADSHNAYPARASTLPSPNRTATLLPAEPAMPDPYAHQSLQVRNIVKLNMKKGRECLLMSLNCARTSAPSLAALKPAL